MKIFKIGATNIKELQIKTGFEKSFQILFENNLESLFDILFVASEFPTKQGGRIDTLAIDKFGSPIIIEYKRNKNENIINQSLSYLKWLLDNKAVFESLCRNKDIDIILNWGTPRIICLAEDYSKFDLDAVEVLPVKFELLCYTFYGENILTIQPKVKSITQNAKRGRPKHKTIKEVKNKLSNIQELAERFSIDSNIYCDIENNSFFIKESEIFKRVSRNKLEELIYLWVEKEYPKRGEAALIRKIAKQLVYSCPNKFIAPKKISSPVEFFHETYVLSESLDDFVPNPDMYDRYVKWCKINKKKIIDKLRFFKDVNKNIPDLRRTKAYHRVKGITTKGYLLKELRIR